MRNYRTKPNWEKKESQSQELSHGSANNFPRKAVLALFIFFSIWAWTHLKSSSLSVYIWGPPMERVYGQADKKKGLRERPFFPTDFKIRTMFGFLLTHPPTPEIWTNKTNPSGHKPPTHPNPNVVRILKSVEKNGRSLTLFPLRPIWLVIISLTFYMLETLWLFYFRPFKINCVFWVTSLVYIALSPTEKHAQFIPSRVRGRGYKIGPVCVCVCPSVSALTAEPFELRS